MSSLKAFARKAQYRYIVLFVFAAAIVISSAGSLVLTVQYITVFDTANRFNPSVVSLTKQNVTADSRLISVYIRLPNEGSRPINIFEYGIYLFLNGGFVAHRDVFPDLTVEPFTNETLLVQFTVTGGYAQVVLQAEQSGQWNWDIRYPMRIRVVWLAITAAYFQQAWTGIQEGF